MEIASNAHSAVIKKASTAFVIVIIATLAIGFASTHFTRDASLTLRLLVATGSLISSLGCIYVGQLWTHRLMVAMGMWDNEPLYMGSKSADRLTRLLTKLHLPVQ